MWFSQGAKFVSWAVIDSLDGGLYRGREYLTVACAMEPGQMA